MKTVKNGVSDELVIKNSRFITVIKNINSANKEDIEIILENVKRQYPKATHYCYAYICNDEKKCSDDNEPSGTAGFPMLNVLEKECLSNVIVIVVRYFGGIKLGAGGLVWAYTKAVTETLKKAFFIELVLGYKIKLQFSYNNQKQVDYLLDGKILEKDYSQDITYIVLIKKEDLEKFYDYSYEILEELYIEDYSWLSVNEVF